MCPDVAALADRSSQDAKEKTDKVQKRDDTTKDLDVPPQGQRKGVKGGMTVKTE
jgi:hypothetical protein